ncbi:MAG TPA: DUF4388 domain-containing protein, partial [Blastocatellia bacterium]|nr:DUF4388 domain-containing protein [Blastocatellia bacterium]
MKTTSASQNSITGHSFLGLVTTLNRRCATGVLRLTQDSPKGQIEKALYFDRGEIYAAASSLPADSPLAILVSLKQINEQQAAEIERQVIGGHDFREALLATQTISSYDLIKLRLYHVTNIFNSICEWKSGSYQFLKGVRVSGGPLGYETLTMVLGQARRVSIPEEFRRLALEPQRRIILTQSRTAPVPSGLTAHEEYLLELIHLPLDLNSLKQTAALSDREIWQGLYALSCAGLIAFVPDLEARAEWVPVEMPAQVPGSEAEPQSVPQAQSLSNEIEAETVSVKIATTQTYIDPDTLDTAFETIETVKVEQKQTILNEQEKAEMLRLAQIEIEKVKATLSSARDDYAVLGLRLGASPTEVRQAYRRMVARFHPDRFQKFADEATLTELNGIVTVLRQAYETATEHAMLHEALTSARERVSSLTGSGFSKNGNGTHQSAGIHPINKVEVDSQSPSATELAASKYKEATLFQKEGDRDEAIRLLKEAIRLDLRNADYH